MISNRFNELANKLVNNCVNVVANDIVIIECFDIAPENIALIIDEVYKNNGIPIVWNKSWKLLQHILNRKGYKKAIDFYSKYELQQMKEANKYISVRASLGENELLGVTDSSKNYFFKEWLGKVHYAERVQNKIWCSCKFPTKISAQNAKLKYSDFLKLFYSSILDFDYSELKNRAKSLQKVMNTTKEVRIITDTTDVTFLISNIPSIICAANRNLPDGEIRTAPVKNSVNGFIKYNVPSIYLGEYFEGIRFEIKNGKIIDYSTDNKKDESLRKILETDHGSKYFGEFAIGLNPLITEYTLDTMFDEKMLGTLHLTPGNSYKNAFNGNGSSIHWDLILDLRNGGKLYFDDVEIINSGKFTPKSLELLNYT